ncbi:ParB/RepB/Spo0J family partition protein [Puerhibacterium puerhi]|uniref:ParB/RepB/Spo0J family partition protein n=1 Tax=Puerhibacterium puerhi TaxID=2692623 RepID=UPI00135A9E12|nr:ParB/RepB/Spo0J family partition protein [Puerhibacterium puerhi]
MTSNTEATATHGTLEHVDPAALVIGANIRTDADLDPDFVASIKDLGVLTPINVQRQQDGTLVVLAGQRRTLAAVEAGLATIPAYVTDANGDEAERIIRQWAENDHRAAMRDTHRTAAIKQLALDFGLSAAQIARRTRTSKDTVTAALDVAGSQVAEAVQAKYDLTLDQAAVVAEFEDDKEAVKTLTACAVEHPEAFAHTAQRLRDQRTEAHARTEAIEALTQAGVPVIEPIGYDDKKAKRLHELRNADAEAGEGITPEAHAQCPGHAAYVSTRWDGVVTVYVCTDWRGHGHLDRYAQAPTSGGPQTEEQKAERRRVIENNKAWRSAETVRREWLAQFAKRKTAPKDAATFLAQAMAEGTYLLNKAGERGHRLATEWLTGKADAGRGAVTGLLAKATPARAQHIALVLALAAVEDATDVHTWRNPDTETRRYFTALEGWGYALAEVEQIAKGQ